VSDRLRPLSLERLVDWVADELAAKGSILGLPRRLAFTPRPRDRFRTRVAAGALETPVGVAAGPHSQLTQNIVVAWLCGARVIELKTVQTRDELRIPRPCIDMQDEGYNVEWSQELPVEQSFAEYLHAWVLIHALHRRLGFPGERPGVVFDVSVGYDLAGLRQPNMQRFLDRVADGGPDHARAVAAVARRFPELREVEVPRRLAASATLSTMHGCPPEEIGAICAMLMAERGLHTAVKLNPTLLGRETVREILGRKLGFHELGLDDTAFVQDLGYPEALDLLAELRAEGARRGLAFGLKLCNTLPVANHRPVFDPAERSMYLSGRPLHALAVTLAHRLAEDLAEPLPMSFAAGADAGNVAALLRCGMRTVTACSDLLRPGGCLRLVQYLENVDTAMAADGAATLDAFIRAGARGARGTAAAARLHLRRYAARVLEDPAFAKASFDRAATKTARPLGLFDCVKPPCTDACAVDQRVPEYMRLVRLGDLDAAAAVTRADNPLASILGRACHHPCERVCLRTHMDRPLAIREIKRLITAHEPPPEAAGRARAAAPPVAVVGAGPCGLAAASFLARARRAVTVFEAREAAGGMVSATIPGYRASSAAVARDLERVAAEGVEIRCGREIGAELGLEDLRAQGFGPIVLAIGARRGRRLGLTGDDAAGVHDGLDFLRAARRGAPPALGRRVGVIGGGDVAMDCARTALRLGAAEVTIYYRRTRAEMPAQAEELMDLLDEGGRLVELVAPRGIRSRGGRLERVAMVRTELGPADASGRPAVQEVEGSEHELELDALIVAVGQQPDLGVLGTASAALTPAGYLAVDPETLETSLPGVYAGGDIAGRGPASIVDAAGDGRRIAEAILRHAGGLRVVAREPPPWPAFDRVDLLRRRSRIEPRVEVPRRPPDQRGSFEEVLLTLSPEVGAAEAWRCLDCDLMCSTCETVCPNRAIFTYTAQPEELAIPRLRLADGRVDKLAAAPFRVAQGPQVAVLADWCNECGNCATFCPTAGRPWRDKPRLHFDRGDFEAARDNAFMVLRRERSRGLAARFDGATHELWLDRDLRYQSPLVRLVLDPRSLAVRRAAPSPAAAAGELVDPRQLGTMVALLRSLLPSMPELPAVDAPE
jgi:putative selenate reductase